MLLRLLFLLMLTAIMMPAENIDVGDVSGTTIRVPSGLFPGIPLCGVTGDFLAIYLHSRNADTSGFTVSITYDWNGAIVTSRASGYVASPNSFSFIWLCLPNSEVKLASMRVDESRTITSQDVPLSR